MKILVVEDDKLTAEALVVILTHQNYTVETAADGEMGWQLIEAFAYDLILLDVTLPKLDGMKLCQRVRSHGYQMPILLLTAHDSSHEKAMGLDAGADDYVVKPFDPEELTARIRALLRRNQVTSQLVLEWGDLQLDPRSCEVSYGDNPLSLTAKEYSLLELFLRNSCRVFSCGALLENLWSFEEIPSDEAVRTHIKGLRQKLKMGGAPPDLIETVYGIGYRLKQKEGGKKQKETRRNQREGGDSLAGVGDAAQRQTLILISKVWQRSQERVSEQVGVLEQAVDALRRQELDQPLQLRAKQEAHTLAGALGTFGLSEGSQFARRIEQALQANKSLSQDEVTHLDNWVRSLRQEIDRLNRISQGESKTTRQDTTHTSIVANDAARPLLLIVDRDRSLAQKLIAAAAVWGFDAEVATNLMEARDKIFLESPDVVILDPAISEVTADSLSLLAELKKQVPPIPAVIFTAHNDLTERLEVARLGGRTCLQKSLPAEQVLEAVNQVLHQAEQTKTGIMVVDDDPTLLAIVRSLLEPWGIRVATLADPQQFWQVLEATSPDLLILDIEMPQISGIDLCQVVRNDAHWSGLPILFLTAHTDSDTVNQVFSVGADDFVSKPIVGPELVTRIINRLERIRLVHNLAEIDSLTGVATRQKATQDLDRFLRLAKRQQQPFCLAILELDLLRNSDCDKSIVEKDEMLRQIGQLLRRSFPIEDVVARWSEEEFIVGVYGMKKHEGIQQLNQLLETLRQQLDRVLNSIQPAAKSSNPVTWSAGVAQFPVDGETLSTLCQSAHTALYQAKRLARNRLES
ncbi:MAG: response regulator [Oscillatoriophycideae cyanobacterium NC_groundwater_1537_Pr4_S-0.65um_50_18]|nr:response regulator [Oscillatoriophycideae cyanobacterium NC_groundwater_1537_Pr4_S-0.65um_50_18]